MDHCYAECFLRTPTVKKLGARSKRKIKTWFHKMEKEVLLLQSIKCYLHQSNALGITQFLAPFGTCYRLLACYCRWRQVSTWDQGMTHGSLSPLTATPAATESRPLCKNSSAATPSRAPYLTARQSWSIISPHYLSTTLSGLFILPFFWWNWNQEISSVFKNQIYVCFASHHAVNISSV